MYDTFSISAIVGDNLTVTGFCNKGDSLTAWLIVTSSTATNTPTSGTTTTTGPTSGTDSLTPLDTGLVVGVAGIVIVFFVLLLMWLKPEYAPEALKRLGSRTKTGAAWLWEKLRGMLS
jgi:hypothetical protein